MTWLKQFLGSNIGLKLVMALSGLGLFGFVLVHMLGNLQVYLGPEKFNAYAAMMQGNPLLWPARIGLLGLVGAHMASAAILVSRSRSARSQAYKAHQWLAGTYAVRTMRWGGVILLGFIVYHLLHMTAGLGGVHPDFKHCVPGSDGALVCSSYHNFVVGFSQPLATGVYIVAMLALGMHLAHGVWSLCRTLGLGNPRYDALARKAALFFGALITVGNISMPIAVLTGIIKP
jgi:succinate dehydrogenase / fumarate reductase cytochrome b subunit